MHDKYEWIIMTDTHVSLFELMRQNGLGERFPQFQDALSRQDILLRDMPNSVEFITTQLPVFFDATRNPLNAFDGMETQDILSKLQQDHYDGMPAPALMANAVRYLATGARRVTLEAEPRLYTCYRAMLEETGGSLSAPYALYVLESDLPQASATNIPGTGQRACITISRDLERRLDDEQLKAILAHEYSCA